MVSVDTFVLVTHGRTAFTFHFRYRLRPPLTLAVGDDRNEDFHNAVGEGAAVVWEGSAQVRLVQQHEPTSIGRRNHQIHNHDHQVVMPAR